MTDYIKTDDEDMKVTRIDPTKVVQAYSGRRGCQCGCRGRYTKNPTSIKRMVNNAMKTESVFIDRNGIAYVVPDGDRGTQYAFYFKED